MENLKNVMPAFLQEDEDRKARWSTYFEGTELANENKKYDRCVIEQLMDNTQRWIQEESKMANVDTFTTYAFPLIRRIFPQLIAKELVSVQPISAPTAMIFYFDLFYSDNMTPTTAGDSLNDVSKLNRFYMSGTIKGEAVGTGDGSDTTFTLDWYPILASTLVVYLDGTATSAFTLSTNDGTKAEITFTSAPTTGVVITADYQVNMEELGKLGNLKVPEIYFDMNQASVTAETKKLKARWTLEAQQDLNAYHGLNAESELVGAMGDELRREIDAMIILDLLNGATAANGHWHYTKDVAFEDSQADWDKTLFHAIVDVDLEIFKKTQRNATWIVASPDVCARLEKMNSFKFDDGKDWGAGNVAVGVQPFGTFGAKYRVYKHPLMPATKMLLGYKGMSWLETGYVYAPYIPFYITPVIVDPNDFTPRRGIMSRFARKMVNGNYYATLNIEA